MNIKIVLVEPSHPGNIGAAARAMKSMGLSRLSLVKPKSFPSADATARAAGADDILAAAEVVDDLADALSDANIAIGCTARRRSHLEWPISDARESAAESVSSLSSVSSGVSCIAYVFGRENSGLTNAELCLCQKLLHIPTVENFSSLNLASAVQLIAYELRVASLADIPEVSMEVDDSVSELASGKELNYFFEHLEKILLQVEFMDPKNPRYLMPKLTSLFNRAMMTSTEVNILRGMLKNIERAINAKQNTG